MKEKEKDMDRDKDIDIAKKHVVAEIGSGFSNGGFVSELEPSIIKDRDDQPRQVQQIVHSICKSII